METYAKSPSIKTVSPLRTGNFKTTTIHKTKSSWTNSTKGIFWLISRLIPKQLRAKYPKGGLSVSLSDKTKEKYTPPPPPPYVAFSGQGTSLGGSSNTQPNKFAKKSKACQNFILEPDRTREVTAIRARLLNGQTITLEANLNTSVQDIYNHIATVSGVSNFELAEGFPPKPVNLSLTVEEADLQGATLIQKGWTIDFGELSMIN